MLTAGDTKTVKLALQRMAMMRSHMRSKFAKHEQDDSRLERVGLTAVQMEEMYRLLAIAKYEDRFVIPTAHKENYVDPYREQGSSGFGMDCSGCSFGSPQPAKKDDQPVYDEHYYGGIWRD
ncbi:Respiratory nitrate reductase 2 beta chain [compost metagenome]